MLQRQDILFFFFFQAEDGIRDLTVTGVQTCALPICRIDARNDRQVVAHEERVGARERRREIRERRLEVGWPQGAADERFLAHESGERICRGTAGRLARPYLLDQPPARRTEQQLTPCHHASRLPQSPRRRYRALRLRGRVVPSQRMNSGNARLWSLVALASAAPHLAEAAWMQRTEAIMGTRVYVQLWADDPGKGNAAMDAVMADMRRIDALMSHYKPASPLSQINAHANSGPVQVDKELFDLIKLSTHYSQITEGAFDITYASVGYLYDYRGHIHPTEEQIRKALPAVNWRNMLLDEEHHSVRFEHPGMRIDLGGIGKGYAVDHGVAILKARGIRHAVLTAGGDSRILGDHMGRPIGKA